MRHFQNILVVNCCTNYICLECCLEFLGSKGIEANSLSDILSSYQYFEELPCPNCNSQGFKPAVVNSQDTIKNYSFSPRVAANLNFGHSPLKIGDSFENLKRYHHYHSYYFINLICFHLSTNRKMIPMEGNNKYNNSPPSLLTESSNSSINTENDSPISNNLISEETRKQVIESYVENILNLAFSNSPH